MRYFDHMKKRQKKLTSLSIFFPTFNEEKNITTAVAAALEIAPQVAQQFEVIVINDGSRDNTAKIVKHLIQTHPEVRLVTQKNKGYGGALKRGFKEAQYDWVFFTDSDLQFNLAELPKFVRKAHKTTVVLGYRKNRAEGFKRQALASALKIWNRVLLGFPRDIKDIDCAFKLINRDVIKTVSPLYSDGAMVSTELLLKIYKAGYDYRQISVKHYDRIHGKATGNNFAVIKKAVTDTFILAKKLDYPILGFIYQYTTARFRSA